MELLSLALTILALLHSLPPSSATATATTTADQLALLSFKSLLFDPTNSLSSWNSTDPHPCRWRGVTCRRAPSHSVTSLSLPSLSLSGTISPSLGQLINLRLLDLSFNSLSGAIPATLSNCTQLLNLTLSSNSLTGNLPPNLTSGLEVIRLDRNLLTGGIPDSYSSLRHLTHLHLTRNNFTGALPSWLGNITSLIRIGLSINRLSGHIPPSLGDLSALYFLDLSQSGMTGAIPPSLGNCSSLAFLSFSQNGLTGAIPASLGRLSSLNTLDLSFNELQGTVPPPIYNLSNILFLSLGKNQLTGSLPTNIGLTLPLLQAFIIQGNRLSGELPLSLANASWVEVFDLSSNDFTGVVPPDLGALPKLYHLSLATNHLEAEDPTSWQFLTSLTNSSKLRNLILSQNRLQGELPAQIGYLPKTLEWLEMDGNRMRGTIPDSIGNLFNLTLLDLSDNLLSGEIPMVVGSKLQVLQVLNLSHNSFSGRIPDSFSNLAYLSELYLDFNNLQGSIPTSLGNNMNLRELKLSSNQLDGLIPKEIVRIYSLSLLLDLSHNLLSGPIPSEIRSLVNLVRLDVSHNRLSGEIPGSIGDCDELQFLYMGSNLLEGPIPTQLSNLKGIQELDLSRNNLSGSIPESFTGLPLRLLDLSFNDLDGEVPAKGVFANASAVSVRGNGNLCSGDATLQLPACSVGHSGHRYTALRAIIASAAVLLCLILVSLFAVLCLKRRRRRTISSSSSSIAGAEVDKYIKLSYSDVYKATNGFSSENLIGSGGFGSVYKGRIGGYKRDIAVKVLNMQQRGALKSFAAECQALRNIRHRNLVKIVTICSSVDSRGDDFRALVFDFMPNGSLDEWLHVEVAGSRQLGFMQRLDIAIDVASALEYLHYHGEAPIVHCDLKPSNVLLDVDMKACVGDFGLARFIRGDINLATQVSTHSAAVKGSIGYVAPEYGMGERLSTRGDVYAYGILMLEMLTGKRPTDGMFKEGLVLREYVAAAYPERVMDIVDQGVLSGKNGVGISGVPDHRMEQCLVAMVRIGLLCSTEVPNERMEMRNVVIEMNAIRANTPELDKQ